jgi:hypothetical protein
VHQSRGDADCACSPARRPGTAMGAGGCQWRCQGRGGRAPHSAGRSCPPSSSMMAGRKGPRNCAIATHYWYILFTLYLPSLAMQYWTSKSQAPIISLVVVVVGEVWGSLKIVSVNIIQRISRIVFQNELTKMIETYTVRVV